MSSRGASGSQLDFVAPVPKMHAWLGPRVVWLVYPLGGNIAVGDPVGLRADGRAVRMSDGGALAFVGVAQKVSRRRVTVVSEGTA